MVSTLKIPKLSIFIIIKWVLILIISVYLIGIISWLVIIYIFA